MPTNTAHKAQIVALEARLNQLADKMASLGNRQTLMDLVPVIHRPGWTTLAEMAFATGIVEAMVKHADAFAELQGALMKGSNAVGKS